MARKNWKIKLKINNKNPILIGKKGSEEQLKKFKGSFNVMLKDVVGIMDLKGLYSSILSSNIHNSMLKEYKKMDIINVNPIIKVYEYIWDDFTTFYSFYSSKIYQSIL